MIHQEDMWHIYFPHSDQPLIAALYRLSPDASELAVLDYETREWRLYKTDYPYTFEDIPAMPWQVCHSSHFPLCNAEDLRYRIVTERLTEIFCPVESSYLAEFALIAHNNFRFEDTQVTRRIEELVEGAEFAGDIGRQRLLRDIIKTVRMTRFQALFNLPRDKSVAVGVFLTLGESRVQAAWPLVQKFLRGQLITVGLSAMIAATVSDGDTRT